MNKKGDMSQLYILMIVVFVIGLSMFALYFGLDIVFDQVVNVTAINNTQPAVDVLNTFMPNVANRSDYMIFVGFMAAIFVFFIVSWIAGSNPIFIPFMFLLVVVATAVSAILSNVFEDFVLNSIFGTTISNFPITNHIIINFPIYIPVIGFSAMILMFARQRLTQG